MTSTETDAFAASIGRIAEAHAIDPGWTPERPIDDALTGLAQDLATVGWYDLATLPDAAEFVGPAAVELGRRASPLREVDALLGGSPVVGGMARHVGVGDVVVMPRPDGLARSRVTSADPVPYGDALGVSRVEHDVVEEFSPEEARSREQAWSTALVGYLGGMAAAGLEMTLKHASNRIAFGGPLTRIESVQQRLADAALDRDGLLLASGGRVGLDELAWAGPAATGVLAQCHQVVGAIGFTLEYPLQRYSRRARAISLWSDAWIEARS